MSDFGQRALHLIIGPRKLESIFVSAVDLGVAVKLRGHAAYQFFEADCKCRYELTYRAGSHAVLAAMATLYCH